jgi:hypothetical protein
MDAAREAARLAARGDDVSALDAARRVGPEGLQVEIRHEGAFIIAKVSSQTRFLPGVALSAEAVVAAEPDP